MYDLISRYAADLKAQPGWIIGALLVLLVSALSLYRSLPARLARPAFAVGLVALALFACGWALHLGWVGDDAYISFRYVQNLVRGHGLVYNPGERVEGYTNFLWVMILAPFAALGLDLSLVSVALTLLSLCATLVLMALVARRSVPDRERLVLPLAAIVFACNYVVACYGTSGLETMFGALLVLWSVERAERGAATAAGVSSILATMTHPDHAIFYVALGVTLALSPERWRLLPRYALPFFALYVPYFAWRWTYYGDLFPNTYYAKSADLVYFRQGFRYLGISGWSAGLWVALPAAAYGVVKHRRLAIARFTAIATPLFLLYVAKIGGDFMLGRLLLPLLPPVFLMAELGVRALACSPRRWARGLGLVALLVFCSAIVPTKLIKPGEKYRYLADERTFYPVASYRPFALNVIYWTWGNALSELFAGLTRKPTLAMGSLGIVGYLTNVRMIDNFGLVHRGVAHTRIRDRGRPGHEKIMSPGMLVQTDADFSDLPPYPAEYERYGSVNLAGATFSTVRYDSALFEALVAKGVRQPELVRFIRDYRPPRAKDQAIRLECDLWYMDQVYFSHNRDGALRSQIIKRVLRARPEWRGYEEFILGEPAAHSSAWQSVNRLTFESLPPGTELMGNAFENNPVTREALGQGVAAGNVGAFINSFQDRDTDAATGQLLTPEFTIEGDALTLRIGGGRYPGSVYAELLVDGQRRALATGCNTEMLGRRLWVTSSLVGQRARLRLVDNSKSPWGHLLLDELVQWRRTGVPQSPEAHAIDPTFER